MQVKYPLLVAVKRERWTNFYAQSFLIHKCQKNNQNKLEEKVERKVSATLPKCIIGQLSFSWEKKNQITRRARHKWERVKEGPTLCCADIS